METMRICLIRSFSLFGDGVAGVGVGDKEEESEALVTPREPVFEDSELSHLAKTGEDSVNVGVGQAVV